MFLLSLLCVQELVCCCLLPPALGMCQAWAEHSGLCPSLSPGLAPMFLWRRIPGVRMLYLHGIPLYLLLFSINAKESGVFVFVLSSSHDFLVLFPSLRIPQRVWLEMWVHSYFGPDSLSFIKTRQLLTKLMCAPWGGFFFCYCSLGMRTAPCSSWSWEGFVWTCIFISLCILCMLTEVFGYINSLGLIKDLSLK